LYFIHFFAFFAVWFSTYFPGWDIALSVLYLAIIGIESKNSRDLSWGCRVISAIIWQAPAIALCVIIITGLSAGGLSNYAIFLLQFWHTPLLPLVSLFPGTLYAGKPVYYYILLGLSFFMVLYYCWTGFSQSKIRWRLQD
jgi:hypothetical protein